MAWVHAQRGQHALAATGSHRSSHPEQRQAAVDLLVEEVRGDRGIDWAIFAALQYLCGLELGRDGQAWKSWWPRVRATYFEEERPEREGEPVFDD